MRWALLFVLLSSPVWAAEKSTPLSLDQARTLLALAGVTVGKVFCEDPSCVNTNRYALSRLDSKQKRPNVFSIEIEITPLPKAH